MNEVLKFLQDNHTFYIATVEGDKPKVRPFGFIMEYEGKLYFCTNNEKNVYKQLKANPNFEVSTTNANGEWIRLKGRAVFDNNPAAKAKVFEVAPALANLYKSPDNPIFEVFYLEDGEAAFYSMTSPSPRIVKL
ncbi:MAG: pyridoxamine 5'-phosphate oxidase family protein [Clostridiales bacterium]|jgi:uncharacterized pyridoxamine 5'-phosphate oxidase family protein|nr:pyridoxamine 5'-phosphate oxidase family protein [Eubacteriales bacterium]MDH7566989.1 pyridoxamine 5'-phosphate oxidase family protein [Clostridiales bacterium]